MNSCGKLVHSFRYKAVGQLPHLVHSFVYFALPAPLCHFLSLYFAFIPRKNTPLFEQENYPIKTGVSRFFFHFSTPLTITTIIRYI